MPNTRKKAIGRPKSHEKRQQILFSASELFLAQGYVGTSMEAVAKASEVSKQTVYSHFKNKDALYNAVIETKCDEYRIDDLSHFLDSQPLSEILQTIASKFIKLLNDESVIAMYQVVIGESKQNSHGAKLFYDAGPLHSINLVANLLTQHPQSRLCESHASEVSLDFFNLLKGEFHMLSILHLPYHLDEEAQNRHAQKVANKTMALINLIS